MSSFLSRDSFEPDFGYLGVFLEEGAPLVDADWNEAQDTLFALSREMARDLGLVGTRDITLNVQAQPETELTVKGGKRPFYVDGVPIRWPSDRPVQIDVGDGWYAVELWMRLGVITAHDHPRMVDPALPASDRQSFRKGPWLGLRLRQMAGPMAYPIQQHPLPQVGTQLLLSSSGCHEGPNALVRLEVHQLRDDGLRASLLWDRDNAAVRSRVEALELYVDAPWVQVADPSGIEPGHVLRLEGPGFHRRWPGWPRVLRVGGAQATQSVYEVTRVAGTRLYLSPRSAPNRSRWQNRPRPATHI